MLSVKSWNTSQIMQQNGRISAVRPPIKKIKLKKTKCLYFFVSGQTAEIWAFILLGILAARARSPSPKPKRRPISLTLSPASFIPKIFPLHITWRYHIMICQAFSIGLRSGEFPGQSIHLKGRLHTKIRNSRIN